MIHTGTLSCVLGSCGTSLSNNILGMPENVVTGSCLTSVTTFPVGSSTASPRRGSTTFRHSCGLSVTTPHANPRNNPLVLYMQIVYATTCGVSIYQYLCTSNSKFIPPRNHNLNTNEVFRKHIRHHRQYAISQIK
jgi:hypothetical protein